MKTDDEELASSVDDKSVLVRMNRNVPVGELGQYVCPRNYISEQKIKEFAIEKYKSGGKGITFEDVVETFGAKKTQAQRTLKHFYQKGVLFQLKISLTREYILYIIQIPSSIFLSALKPVS